VRERAVHLVLDNPGQHESRWQAIVPVPSKICRAVRTLNRSYDQQSSRDT